MLYQPTLPPNPAITSIAESIHHNATASRSSSPAVNTTTSRSINPDYYRVSANPELQNLDATMETVRNTVGKIDCGIAGRISGMYAGGRVHDLTVAGKLPPSLQFFMESRGFRSKIALSKFSGQGFAGAGAFIGTAVGVAV